MIYYFWTGSLKSHRGANRTSGSVKRGSGLLAYRQPLSRCHRVFVVVFMSYQHWSRDINKQGSQGFIWRGNEPSLSLSRPTFSDPLPFQTICLPSLRPIGVHLTSSICPLPERWGTPSSTALTLLNPHPFVLFRMYFCRSARHTILTPTLTLYVTLTPTSINTDTFAKPWL